MILTNLLGRTVTKADSASPARDTSDPVECWPFGEEDQAEIVAVFQSPEKRGLTVHLRCLGDSSDGFGLWATALESCSLVREPAPVTPYDHAGDRTRKLAQSIDLLDLSVRTKTRLANAGIRTLGALVTGSSLDLLRLPGFGKTSLKEVEQKLAKLGLALADA